MLGFEVVGLNEGESVGLAWLGEAVGPEVVGTFDGVVLGFEVVGVVEGFDVEGETEGAERVGDPVGANVPSIQSVPKQSTHKTLSQAIFVKFPAVP